MMVTGELQNIHTSTSLYYPLTTSLLKPYISNMILIRREVCGYCGACVSVCPQGALELIDAYLEVNNTLCKPKCKICQTVCPLGAITREEK